MTDPYNAPYRRRFPDPRSWASNEAFGRFAEEATRRRVNELSWSLAGEDLAAEIEQVLQGGPMPPSTGLPQRRRRRGDRDD